MTAYDCFIFNHELDLLELRLHTHADSFDKFVLVESERTHLNKPKPLYFADNRERFEAFADKIIHVVVKADAFPEGEGDAATLLRENAQRDAIGEGLVDAQPDDLIMVSDVDEILRPGTLAQFSSPVSVVDMAYYRHYFNLYAPEMLPVRKKNWLRRLIRRLTHPTYECAGPVILRMRHFPGGHAQRDLRRFYGPLRLGKRNPFKPLLERRNPYLIRNGAWHFHGVMDAEDLAMKMRDSAHPTWLERYPDKEAAARLLAEAPTRLYNSWASEETTIKPVIEPLDERFPAWLLANRERFADRILPYPPTAAADLAP